MAKTTITIKMIIKVGGPALRIIVAPQLTFDFKTKKTFQISKFDVSFFNAEFLENFH